MKKQYINFIKIISILLVILIHIISRAWNNYNLNTREFNILTFIDCLCRCSVPLFVMCSGAIFLNRNDGFKKIVFKYILKIYIIFIIFNTFYQIVDFIIYKDGILNISIIIDFIINSLLLKSIYHLWYLRMIMIMYMFIPLFKILINLKKKYIDILILILLFFFFIILPLFINNNDFHYFVNLLGYVLYLYLGFFIEKYGNKKYLIPLFILSSIGFVYMFLKTINYNIKTEYFMNYLTFSVVFISSFVYMTVMVKSVLFEKENVKKILNCLVRYNFFIYLIHGLVIGMLQYINVINIYKYKNVFLILVYVTIIYILCFIISWIVFKIYDSVRNKLFLKGEEYEK